MHSRYLSIEIPAFIAAVVASALLLTGCQSGQGTEDPSVSVEAEHREAGGDEHGQEASRDLVPLAAAGLEEFGIEVRKADSGEIRVTKVYPGEVRVNEDRYAHVVPRVSGIVRAVYKSLGDDVKAGEVMAVLESRELADAKAAYLADLERLNLAVSNFGREERLFAKKISSEQEYLVAKQALAEARIDLRSAHQKLRALGFSEEYIESLPDEPEASLIRYPLTAPISGTIVEKHITQGEALDADAETFEVADLTTVWVDLSIYQKDMGLTRESQKVTISSGDHSESAEIAYVRPIIGEDTRTALARVILPNPHGRWRPGMFVNGLVSVDFKELPLVVLKSAVQQVEGDTVIFVKTDAGFEPRPVSVGDEDAEYVAVTSGIAAGDEYVAKGSFALKAQLQKRELSVGHAH